MGLIFKTKIMDKYFKVSAKPRFIEDAWINNQRDTDDYEIITGMKPKMPFLDTDFTWNIIIDLETGKILNWPEGTTAKVHYKVCDECSCGIYDENMHGKLVEDYVPKILAYSDDSYGFGDYIILDIESDGHLKDFPTGEKLQELLEDYRYNLK